jgi:hypothetical protein
VKKYYFVKKMSDEKISLKTEIEEEKSKLTKEDFSFFANFDIVTVRILQKFYSSSLDPLNKDINCFYVQQLQKILLGEGLKINLESLRKKLEFLVKIGFVEKVDTYPRVYIPLRDVEKIKKIQNKISKLKEMFL